MLPEYTRSRANSYLDWIGPAVARHPDFGKFGVLPGGQFVVDSSKWKIDALPFSSVMNYTMQESHEENNSLVPEVEVNRSDEIDEQVYDEVKRRFDWSYEYSSSIAKRSKQTVSELKRLSILAQQEDEDPFMEKGDEVSTAYLHARPNFMQTRKLTPAEIGTAMHTIMQHIDFQIEHNGETVGQLIKTLITRQLITPDEANAVQVNQVTQFFKSDMAKRVNSQKKYFESYRLRMRMMEMTEIIKSSKESRIVYSKRKMVGCYLTTKPTGFMDDSILKAKSKMKCKTATGFS